MKIRSLALIVASLLAPLPAVGQKPETAQDWIALFDQWGPAAGVSRAVVPCDLSNPVGKAVLDGLLRRSWSDRRAVELATELGQIRWSWCPDARVDRWLSGALNRFLDQSGISEVATVTAAIAERGAPPELLPWLAIATDARRPVEVRTDAMYREMERRKKPAELVAWFLEIMSDGNVPDEFVRVQSAQLTRRLPDHVLRHLNARMLLTLPRADALIDGLGAIARGRVDGATGQSMAAAQQLLLEAADLAPPERKSVFTDRLHQGGR